MSFFHGTPVMLFWFLGRGAGEDGPVPAFECVCGDIGKAGATYLRTMEIARRRGRWTQGPEAERLCKFKELA